MNGIQVGKTEFYDYIFDKSDEAIFPLCSESVLVGLSSIENFLVDFIFWHRNHKKGLQYSITNELFIGAQGVLGKNRIWNPTGFESCDYSGRGPWGETTDKKKTFDPYFYKKHCCSLTHVAFLVKHRPSYIISKIRRNFNLAKLHFLYDHYMNDNFPLLFNYIDDKEPKRTIVRDFASEYFSIAYPARLSKKPVEVTNEKT